MQFHDLQPVKFKELAEDTEFWKPLTSGRKPEGLEDLTGPYYVYTATGHVLNKLFQLPRRLEDHELVNVAFEPDKRELYLMSPSEIVYVCRNE